MLRMPFPFVEEWCRSMLRQDRPLTGARQGHRVNVPRPGLAHARPDLRMRSPRRRLGSPWARSRSPGSPDALASPAARLALPLLARVRGDSLADMRGSGAGAAIANRPDHGGAIMAPAGSFSHFGIHVTDL